MSWDPLPQQMREAHCDSLETRSLLGFARALEVCSDHCGDACYFIAELQDGTRAVLCWHRSLQYVQWLRTCPAGEAMGEAFRLRSSRERSLRGAAS